MGKGRGFVVVVVVLGKSFDSSLRPAAAAAVGEERIQTPAADPVKEEVVMMMVR